MCLAERATKTPVPGALYVLELALSIEVQQPSQHSKIKRNYLNQHSVVS
jgi:hypothetical protein